MLFLGVLVAFNLVWTVVEMPVITRDFAGGGAGKRQLLKKPICRTEIEERQGRDVEKLSLIDASDQEKIERWLWCNRVREVLMLGAGIVGGLGWWMVACWEPELGVVD